MPRGLAFAIPESPHFAVERSRLTTLLDVAATQRLTVVVAPPGYGKTVLLSQWARAQRRPPVSWLTLGAEHNDPTALLEDLSEVVATRGPSVAPRDPHRPRRPVHAGVRSRFLNTLTAGLERLPATTLVLDDFHQLSNPVVIDLLGELFDHAPRSLHVIAASRVDPPLRFFRLHDPGVLFQLRQEDLAFGVEESTELVHRLTGIELTTSQAAALVERTEGWVAGLQLAALALPGHADVEEFVVNFAGDDRAVADYLTERVLGGLPEDLRAFLSTTCLLERMSGPLCDAVAGRDDSHSMLDQLERRSMFIAALDRDRSWFRYHRLFRTYLRTHLRDARPISEHVVHRRAAEWHRAHGDLDTAVQYLRMARSWDGILEIAASAGTAMVQHGRAAVVATWIGSVPDPERPDHAAVGLAEAAAMLAAGELLRAQPILDELATSAATTAPQRGAIHLLRAWCALRVGALATALAEAERASTVAEDLDPAEEVPMLFGLARDPEEIRVAADVVRGAALVHLGRFGEARRALRTESDTVHARWQLLALGSRALLEAWSERLEPADQLAHRTLRLGGQLGLEDDPACLHAVLAGAVVARNRGELEAARKLLEDASLIALSEDDRLTAADLVNEHALLALAEGDAAACLTALADQASPARGRSFAATGRRPALEADAYLAIGDVERAARSLAEASDEAPDVVGARVRLELARGDLDAARQVVTRWPEEPTRERTPSHLLAMAVVEHLDGEEAAASVHLDEVVRQAELDGNVGMFRWPEARSYVRSRYRSTPTAFLRAVVEQPIATPRPTAVKRLIEQLTEREYFVLQLLPTRLTNAEIARSLGISLNTVKTHLKHVYRKLEVEHRSEAIAAAERLGLL